MNYYKSNHDCFGNPTWAPDGAGGWIDQSEPPRERRMKGSRKNPLSLLDLPFTVPQTGVYWISIGDDEPMELPEAPEGSVLDLEVRVSGGSSTDGGADA